MKSWRLRERLESLWNFAKKPESTNVATAAATIVIAVATIFTWQEIRSGSTDTHGLAVAAGQQAEALKVQSQRMESLATAASTQAAAALEQVGKLQLGVNETHELAVQAKNQADSTKEVASQSLAQARSTNDLAVQAGRSAEIAQQQLRLA
jgi:hypothetical protein